MVFVILPTIMSTHALISILLMVYVTVKYKDYIYDFQPTEL